MSNPFDPDDQEDQDPEAVRGLIAAARASGDFDMDLSQDPEALGANAFSRLRSQMLDQGKSNAPVQHFVDPRNEMSPEQFLSAAQGRDDVDPNMTMSPEQFSEAAAIRGLKSLAPPPPPRDAAELRGIAPDEAKARLDQQLQLLPEREASMRPQGTPPTPDVKATTPPPDDATDERPASQASVVSPDTRARLPDSEDKGAMPSLQLRAESKEPPAMRGYTPDAIRGLTGRSSRTDDEGPDVNPLAVLAAALDRNPGRALAEVMSVAGQQKSAWQANRQKQAQQDIENDVKGRLTNAQIKKLEAESDPELLKQRADTAAGNLAARQETVGQAARRLGISEDRYRQLQSVDSPLLTTQVQQRQNLAGAGVEGAEDKKTELTDQIAAQRGAVARRVVDAQQAGLTAAAPALEAARGEGRAVAEDTERSGKVQTARDTTTARIAAEQPTRQAEKSEEFQTRFAEKNKALLGARQSLGEVSASAQDGGAPEGLDYGSRVLFALPFGSNFNSETANANIERITNAATEVIHDRSGAAFSSKEAAQNLLTILGSPTASAEQRASAIQRFSGSIDADLRGQAVRPEDAQSVINRRGIGGLDVTSGPPKQRSRGQALQDLLQPKPVSGPANQGGTAMYIVSGASGATKRALTAEQAARLEKAGLQVEAATESDE